MSLRLNNSKDITCDKLWLLDANNNLQDVLTLINNAGSGGSGGVVQSAILPLSITNGVLSTLFKPTNVTTSASSGIYLLQNDTLGTLNLSLNFLEERDRIKIKDNNNVVKDITVNNRQPIMGWCYSTRYEYIRSKPCKLCSN